MSVCTVIVYCNMSVTLVLNINFYEITFIQSYSHNRYLPNRVPRNNIVNNGMISFLMENFKKERKIEFVMIQKKKKVKATSNARLNKYKTAPYFFYQTKTWHTIVCWFLCFYLNLPDLMLKLFCFDVQNNFRFRSGKFT